VDEKGNEVRIQMVKANGNGFKQLLFEADVAPSGTAIS
jgi:hypothetical protein